MKTDTENKGSKLTTVKTIYARAAVLLLALNFCLTGYVVLSIADIQQDQLGESPKSNTARYSTESTGSTEGRQTTPSTTELRTRETQQD